MFIHRVGLFTAGLALALFGVASVEAQSSGSDTLKKLESDLKRVCEQLKELEGQLEKARAAAKTEKKDDKGGPWRFGKGGFGGFGRFGPNKKFDPSDKKKFEEMFKNWKGGKGFGRGSFKKDDAAKKPDDPAKKETAKSTPSRDEASQKLEARIDQIIRELQELRSQLKK